MLKNIAIILGVILIFLFHTSFSAQFPNFQTYVNIPLLFTTAVVLFGGFRTGLIIAIVGGIILDAYSLYANGVYILTFAIPVVLGRFILKNWLTNKSTLSIALYTMVSTFSFHLALFLLTNGTYLVGLSPLPFPLTGFFLWVVVGQVALNTFLMVTGVKFLRLISTKFNVGKITEAENL